MRFVTTAFLLAIGLAMTGCGERPMTPAEQVQQFTIDTKMTKQEAYRASEAWVAETFVGPKTVMHVRQAETGTLSGTSHLPDGVVPGAVPSPNPGEARVGTALGITITSQDNAVEVTFSLTPRDVDADGATYYVAQNRRLADSLATALSGTISKAPAAAAPAPRAAAAAGGSMAGSGY